MRMEASQRGSRACRRRYDMQLILNLGHRPHFIGRPTRLVQTSECAAAETAAAASTGAAALWDALLRSRMRVV